jgi:hypothetical protein
MDDIQRTNYVACVCVRKILFVELVFCLVFLDVVLVSLLEVLSGGKTAIHTRGRKK